MKVQISGRTGCLEVNAAELFADPAFVDWLNGPDRPATWYRGGEPDEFSDVFVAYDHGGGSAEMPDHCWNALRDACEEAGFTRGVLRITNFPG